MERVNGRGSLLSQSLEMCLKTGTNRGLADTLEGFAALALDDGQAEVAVHLLGVAAAICEEKGIPRAPDEQPAYERQLALLRGVLGEAAFQTSLGNGSRHVHRRKRRLRAIAGPRGTLANALLPPRRPSAKISAEIRCASGAHKTRRLRFQHDRSHVTR